MEEWDKAFSALIEAGDIKECLKIIEHIENQELISKLARILIEKGKLKEAKEVVKQLEDEKAKLYEAYILSQEGKTEEAYRIASEIVKDLKGEEKQIAIRIITDYYRESEKWKEITILLSPLETTKLLSDKDRLLLAEAYIHTGDYPRALRILANLMETELRKDAKRLIKKIKEECEEEQVREVCEQLLAEDSFFKRLKEGLSKSRSSIVQQIENLFTEGKKVDAKTLEELEEILLAADVGVEATQQILSNIKRRMEIGEIKNESSLISALEEEILKILKKAEGKLVITEKPFVIMVVGVNGTGKTTSIAKLAYYLKNKGYSVLLAAGDTFRAAAIEQLETWGKRLGVDVIKQKPQADPSGVVYDAVKAAKARNVDVVIIDTAGRLHTKVNLMEELKKMARVASRELPGAPHETLLVLDAVVGQNAISQAKIFSEAIPITGIILTKLDGTAKGGVIIAIAKLFNIPIKFIGVGEKIDDLQEFNAERFVDALFER
ncbi:MAG: signal recognition particle-docking protein FtsY [Deferribacteres bacterium]|nr:signal recognition particle-docking protein FtsY [Deferribacteres bacterium]